MQQVEQVLQGERDYALIKGDTGPLWYCRSVQDNVDYSYPAGHVWIYTALYKITSQGRDIFGAQVIFMILYLATLAIALSLYRTTKVLPSDGMMILTAGPSIYTAPAMSIETITQYLHVTHVQRLLDAIFPAHRHLALRQATVDCWRYCVWLGLGSQNECSLILPWSHHCRDACDWT